MWGEPGDYQHQSVNHSLGEFVRYASDGRFVSSNKTESLISVLKRGIRKHNGFTYPRFWLWLEEFIYHMNNSGPQSHADFRHILETLGAFGMLKLADGLHHSVYYEYTREWQLFCNNQAHQERKDCDCTRADDGDVEEDPAEEEEGAVNN